MAQRAFVARHAEMSNVKGTIDVSIILRTDPEPVIEATTGGRTITYRPTAADPPGCD